MRRNSRARRHRVAVRPKVRSQRIRQAAAIGAMGCMAGLAALTVVAVKRETKAFAAVALHVLPTTRSVEVTGIPDSLRVEIETFLRDKKGGATSADILERFPEVRAAALSRSYWRRSLRCEAVLRRSIAVVEEKGKPAGLLDEDGTVFAAPEGLVWPAGPNVELDGSSDKERKALAAFLPEVEKPGALDSGLVSMRYLSPHDGWQASFRDGTLANWGDLRFTHQKLDRLREILTDAREQFGGALAADLRYFEDGRVLIRPAGRQVGLR